LTATLPEGWEERCAVIDNENTRFKKGHCVELHDLVVSKLVAFREKDRDFVRDLLIGNFVTKKVLYERIKKTPCDEQIKERMRRWLDYTEI
jgi:hypothetical protein